MHVLRWKKFPATLLEPTFASARLTLRAVPISTRVVGDGAMSAEHGRATPRNGQQHFDMLPGDPLTASFDEGVSRSAECLSVCGCTSFWRPARWAASLQASQTTLVVIGVAPVCQRLPGNSQALGLRCNPRQ